MSSITQRILLGMGALCVLLGLGIALSERKGASFIFIGMDSQENKTGKAQTILVGESGPIQIWRDPEGIPQVFAVGESDSFMGLGFVQAQDQLFKLEMGRRFARGKLSEVFGPKALKLDKLARTLQWQKSLQKIYENQEQNLSADFKGAIKSYVAGINLAMAQGGAVKDEFSLLGLRPKAFTVEDIWAYQGVFHFAVEAPFYGDILRSELLHILGPQKLRLLFPHPWKSVAPEEEWGALIKEEEGLVGLNNGHGRIAEIWFSTLSKELGIYSFPQGLAVALAPEKVESVHRGSPPGALLYTQWLSLLTLPSPWYQAHLYYAESSQGPGELHGYFWGAIPFPLIGNNKHGAWTFLPSRLRTSQIYQELAHPENPQLLKTAEGPKNIESTTESIIVRGPFEVKIPVESGPHGPLLTALVEEVVRPQILSLKSPLYHPDNLTLVALYGVSKSTHLMRFEEALRFGGAPFLFGVYAGIDGQIGAMGMGKIPERPKHLPQDLVLRGDTGEHDWDLYVPFEQNPKEINPSSGVLVLTDERPSFFSRGQGIFPFPSTGQRQEELSREIQGRKWSKETLKMALNQNIPSGEKAILDLLLLKLDKQTYFKEPSIRSVFQKLAELQDQWAQKGPRNMLSLNLGDFSWQLSFYLQWKHQLALDLMQEDLGTHRPQLLESLPESQELVNSLLLSAQKNPLGVSPRPGEGPVELVLDKKDRDIATKVYPGFIARVTASFMSTYEDFQKKQGKDWWEKQGRMLETSEHSTFASLELVHPLGELFPWSGRFSPQELPWPKGPSGLLFQSSLLSQRWPTHLGVADSSWISTFTDVRDVNITPRKGPLVTGRSIARLVQWSGAQNPPVCESITPLGNANVLSSLLTKEHLQTYLKGELRSEGH